MEEDKALKTPLRTGDEVNWGGQRGRYIELHDAATLGHILRRIVGNLKDSGLSISANITCHYNVLSLYADKLFPEGMTRPMPEVKAPETKVIPVPPPSTFKEESTSTLRTPVPPELEWEMVLDGKWHVYVVRNGAYGGDLKVESADGKVAETLKRVPLPIKGREFFNSDIRLWKTTAMEFVDEREESDHPKEGDASERFSIGEY